jgi:hypothetical protein
MSRQLSTCTDFACYHSLSPYISLHLFSVDLRTFDSPTDNPSLQMAKSLLVQGRYIVKLVAGVVQPENQGIFMESGFHSVRCTVTLHNAFLRYG